MKQNVIFCHTAGYLDMVLKYRNYVLCLKAAIVALLTFLVCHEVLAQGGYRITARYSGSFRFQTIDVWNSDLQYMGNAPVQGYLEAIVTDVRGRKLVLMQSDNFNINPGNNSLSSTSISTRKQQYFLQGLAEFEAVQGSLPAGTYNICYTAFCAVPDCGGLGQGALYNEFPECVQMTVEPPTPLLLAYPENGAELDIRRLGFMWIPPMPLSQVPGFSYTYSLYQAQKGQTCSEAVLRNPPLYRADGIEQPSIPYPPEQDDLDTGKTYCWKVDGFLSGLQVAQSEVWRLKVREEKPEKRKLQTILPQLVPSTEPYTLTQADTVVVVFNEDYLTDNNHWNAILLIEGQNSTENYSQVVLTPRFTGSGNIYFLPAENTGIRRNQQYMLIIKNAKNDEYKARIIFK